MAIKVYNQCTTRRPATREGYLGSSFTFVPFLGYWSPSGKQLAFPSSTLGVAKGTTMSGRTMPDTFSKGSSLCR